MIRYTQQLKEMQADLDNRFTYHAPTGDQPKKYELLRAQAKELARNFVLLCPPSRELALALVRLEEAMMWANAGIARQEVDV